MVLLSTAVTVTVITLLKHEAVTAAKKKVSDFVYEKCIRPFYIKCIDPLLNNIKNSLMKTLSGLDNYTPKMLRVGKKTARHDNSRKTSSGDYRGNTSSDAKGKASSGDISEQRQQPTACMPNPLPPLKPTTVRQNTTVSQLFPEQTTPGDNPAKTPEPLNNSTPNIVEMSH
jgi:hypothetical protein